jgi:hypothetical protein
MNNKVSLQDVERVMREFVPDTNVVQTVITQIRQITTETTVQNDPVPKTPTQNIAILVGAQEELDKIDESQLYAYMVTCDLEDIDQPEKLSRLVPHMMQKAVEFNSKKKRKSSRVKKLVSVFEKLKPKFDLNGFPKRIVTKKEPALIIKTTNLSIAEQNG